MLRGRTVWSLGSDRQSQWKWCSYLVQTDGRSNQLSSQKPGRPSRFKTWKLPFPPQRLNKLETNWFWFGSQMGKKFDGRTKKSRRKEISRNCKLCFDIVLLSGSWNHGRKVWWKMRSLEFRCHLVYITECNPSLRWRYWQTNPLSCQEKKLYL